MVRGICFVNLVDVLDNRLQSEMIIPVMDGFDKATVNEFSRFIKNRTYAVAGIGGGCLGGQRPPKHPHSHSNCVTPKEYGSYAGDWVAINYEYQA